MKAKHILVVEDNHKDELLMRRSFEKLNLVNDLVFVHDGAEALDYLSATGEYGDRDVTDLPQVILLDLKLPKIGGLEVLKRIRQHERTRRIPVVILTSSDEEEDRLRSYDLGANSYVRKPVDFTQFAESVAQLGTYWMMLNEPPI